MLQLQSPSNKKFDVREIISCALAKASAEGAAPLQADRLKRLHLALTSHRSISHYAQISQTDTEALAREVRAALDSIGFGGRPKPVAAKKKAAVARVARPQTRLFEDAWPPAFDYIAERFPRRPFVTNDLELGVTIRPIDAAMSWAYIQYNSPVEDHLLIIDYDCPNGVPVGEIWQEAGLPAPAWITNTRGTGKGHIAYSMATPVCTTDAGRLKPLQYLARIEEGYRKAINGDACFTGLLTKNPLHQDAWEVTWIDPTPRTLDELASAVKIERFTRNRKKALVIEPVGLGRKVLTFERVRHWAYAAVSRFWGSDYDAWHAAVRDHVDSVNRDFKDPLPEGHCKAIAKSIARWVWARFTPLTKHQLVIATHTPAVQALRGSRKGAKKREQCLDQAKSLIESGLTQREVAGAIGVTDRTLRNWLLPKAEKAYIR